MRILAVTGGHSFDRDAFAAFLSALPGDITWAEHPDAGIDPELLAGFDASLHYDMPGTLPEPEVPPDGLRAALWAAPETGHGYVVLHHALAAWAGWPEWAEFVGGAYRYRPGLVRGAPCPDSGYRHDVRQRFTVVDPVHPVATGLPGVFDLVDETYLCQVFEQDVTPLLRTDAPMTDDVHFSTALAMAGRRDERAGWRHPPGSSLAGWTREHGRARLVYLQPGDGVATLGDPTYRALVGNALEWVCRRR